MSVCGGWSLVNLSTNPQKIITLYCRSWQCPDCAPFRASALRRLANDGQPRTFLTLTVNPAEGQSAEERARQLSDALKIVIKRARRKFTKAPIEYLAVFEETKKGEPHLHLLMRAPYLPQKWLSAQMDELIAAPIVDIRRVGNAAHAARYVAKYVSKASRTFGKLKRYWTSKGYDLQAANRPERVKSDFPSWRIDQRPAWIIAEEWMVAGYNVTAVNDHEWQAFVGDRAPPREFVRRPLIARAA